MALELTILGFNSAIPTVYSHPTAQVVNVNERYLLIDCGEGTQVQLRKAKIKFSKIDHVFISHLHGDHVFGLIGFISTQQLLGRQKPLHIYGPVGIKTFIKHQISLTDGYETFELDFHELSSTESEKIYEDKKIEVFTIPLAHRVYCNGYLIKEKPKLRTLRIEEVKKYEEIQTCDYLNLKNGKDFIGPSGKVIPNDALTYPPPPSKSYAFCSDTMYKPDIIPIIQNVDLLYHEATFMHELHDLALRTGHSTAKEAGLIAEATQAKKLILGHFSNRYTDYTPLQEEAQSVYQGEVIIPKVLETYSA